MLEAEGWGRELAVRTSVFYTFPLFVLCLLDMDQEDYTFAIKIFASGQIRLVYEDVPASTKFTAKALGWEEASLPSSGPLWRLSLVLNWAHVYLLSPCCLFSFGPHSRQ